MTDTIRMLAVDDHPVVLSGLSAMLKNNKDIEIVGLTASVKKAVEMTKKLQPDVVVMSLSLALQDEMESIRQMRSQSPGSRILVFSCLEKEEFVMQALKAGASGFLSKKAGLMELEQAVTRLAQGESWLSPSLITYVLDQVTQENREIKPIVKLTKREQEVLQYMASGYGNQEIAGLMSLSMATVHSHVSHLLEKLNASNRTQAVIFAMRAGLILEK